jgi:zinc transport system ATP-binding protein
MIGGPEAVTISGLTFSYGDMPVLEGIELSLAQGEFLGLVGPNAGGKSTLLKLILGLLEPQAGRVLVLGRRWRRAACWAMSRSTRASHGTFPSPWSRLS